LNTGFTKKNKSDFDVDLLIIQPINLFVGVNFFCKISASIINRKLNNYYGLDAYCKNSKALSLSASKMAVYNNFRKNQ